MTIKISTVGYSNTFERTFYPPIGLINIETHTENIAGLFTYYILDGAKSYTIGDGIYLVNWSWDFNTNEQGYGQKIRVNNLTNNHIYLTIRDNMGMVSKVEAIYN